MKKILNVNDDLYIVVGTAPVKVTNSPEQLKKQYPQADAVLSNGDKYYVCMKTIEAEFTMVK